MLEQIPWSLTLPVHSGRTFHWPKEAGVRSWRVGAGVVAAAAVVAAAGATAKAAEFDLGIGYAHVELDGSASPFDSRGGLRVEPRFSWSPGGYDAPLRLGLGLAISGFERSTDDDRVFTDEDGDVFIFDSDDVESLTLLTPEFQVSYRLMLGPEDLDREKKWFVEPGVGVGVVVAQYWVGETFGWWTATEINEWDATIAGRPFIRAGYQGQRWVLGLEASYLFGGSLQFTEDIGGDVSEWHVGAFFGGRW